MLFVKWMDKLNKLIEVVIGVMLAVMTIIIFYQVLIRFVISSFGFQISAPWTEELARYLMIWLIFLGGAVATRKARLIGIEVLVYALPTIPGTIIKYGAHMLALSFYTSIFIMGLEWAQFGSFETSPAMKISMIYIYSSLSVGTALMILNTLVLFVETFLTKRDIREPVED